MDARLLEDRPLEEHRRLTFTIPSADASSTTQCSVDVTATRGRLVCRGPYHGRWLLRWVRGGETVISALNGVLSDERPTIRIDDDWIAVIGPDARFTTRLTSPFGTAAHALDIAVEPALLRHWLRDQPVAKELEAPYLVSLEGVWPSDSSFGAMMQMLWQTLVHDVAGPEWYREQVEFLVTRLFRHHAQCVRQASPRRQWSATVERESLEVFQRVMRARFTLVSDPSERPGGNEHLTSAFRRVHGVTPERFVASRRLSIASRFLTHSRLPVSEIAARCGFVSRATFHRAIRGRFGCSPLELRKGLGSIAS